MALTGGAIFTSKDIFSRPLDNGPSIACQQYTWFSYYQREGKSWMADPEASYKDLRQAGVKAFEPSFDTPEDVPGKMLKLTSNKISTKSMYVNSVLHDEQMLTKNIAEVMAIAAEARKSGMEILVTNPTPLSWNGIENKSDQQLLAQATALDQLGEQLRNIGMTLAYHNHDAEMRQSAREFHHMLTGTRPENVKLCLDAHWIYRGAGNSQVALFDIVTLYADRIVELHLRQSQDGIWSETFDDGDIDYARLALILKQKNLKPHLVLEQATEKGTPNTMDAVTAIGNSLTYAKRIFRDFA